MDIDWRWLSWKAVLVKSHDWSIALEQDDRIKDPHVAFLAEQKQPKNGADLGVPSLSVVAAA